MTTDGTVAEVLYHDGQEAAKNSRSLTCLSLEYIHFGVGKWFGTDEAEITQHNLGVFSSAHMVITKRANFIHCLHLLIWRTRFCFTDDIQLGIRSISDRLRFNIVHPEEKAVMVVRKWRGRKKRKRKFFPLAVDDYGIYQRLGSLNIPNRIFC